MRVQSLPHRGWTRTSPSAKADGLGIAARFLVPASLSASGGRTAADRPVSEQVSGFYQITRGEFIT
jgi:hypothetical protein